jgi:hypothetical protein
MTLALAMLVGCVPDDWDGTPYVPDTGDPATTADTDTDVPVEGGLVGTWLSEGDDLSELFAGEPFDYERVTTTFRANGAYTGAVVDRDGATATVSGTWTTDDSSSPATIALSQAQPYEALASGIYAISGDVLTYEVVQTSPDYGFSPPTPAGGFGSTSGPDLDPGVNVQIYRRQ